MSSNFPPGSLNDVKPWYQSRTIWVNVLTVLVAIMLSLVNNGVLPPQLTEFLLMIVGIINIILRFLTDEPITEKK